MMPAENVKSLTLTLPVNVNLPLYQQIKNAITQKIKNGDWQPGQMIPSENQLVTALGASRMTINRSLRELTAEGLLKRVHGVGTFVAEPPRHASLIELRSIADEVLSQGKRHRAEVLSLHSLKAKGELLGKMAVAKGELLFHVVVVHYQDNVPIQLEDRYVNAVKAPNFIDMDFTKITTTAYLTGLIRPNDMEHIVQAVMPDSFIATHLAIPMNEPCLKLQRRTWENGETVTAVNMIYPSSRYDLGARYSPLGAASKL